LTSKQLVGIIYKTHLTTSSLHINRKPQPHPIISHATRIKRQPFFALDFKTACRHYLENKPHHILASHQPQTTTTPDYLTQRHEDTKAGAQANTIVFSGC
jgi:hypothetical protein